MLKKLSLSLLLMSSFASQAEEINNQAYSFIGFAYGQLTYKESGTLSSGLTFVTNPSTNNIFNQSGGYTPVEKKAGFYINTVSTLTSTSNDEYWKANGTVTNGDVVNSVNGVYQQNIMASAHNELDILGSYFLAPGHQVIFGGSFTKSLMDRNSFTGGAALSDFNNAQLTPAIGNANITDPTNPDPDLRDPGAKDLNDNGILDLDELVATYGASPKTQIVNFTETFVSVVAQVGYNYDSYFASKELGLRWKTGFMVGAPLYYDVNNTSNPTLEFTDAFNGYNFKGYLGIGWRVNKYVNFIAKADYFFRYRDRVNVSLGFNEELQRDRTAFIPENEIEYMTFSLMAYWNFG